MMEQQGRSLERAKRFSATSDEKSQVGYCAGSPRVPGKERKGTCSAPSNRSREFVRRIRATNQGHAGGGLEGGAARTEREQPGTLDTGNKYNGANGITVYMYHRCISVLAKNDRWRKALDVLDGRRRRGGVIPNVHCVTDALSACANAGQWERALELLTEAQGWGFEGNTISYNVVLNGFDKGGLSESALKTFREMETLGVPGDAFTYKSAITACGNGGQWERALGLLKEMRSAGVTANSFCYNSAMAACAKAGKCRQALALLREMRTVSIEPTVVSYNAAITACGNGGRWEQALDLLKEMAGMGLRRDLYS